MRWDLADYSDHPIDGEASQIRACSEQLGSVVADIQDQIMQLRALNAGDVWVSAAGAHEMFQDTVDDLPEKLDLVAIRYQATAEALDAFCPVLERTKVEAERNILLAEEAFEEYEYHQGRIEDMEAFEEHEQAAADAYNDDLEPGDEPTQPDEWPGPDHRALAEDARERFEELVAEVREAVEDFNTAAEICTDALDEAGNDDLKNDSGLGASLRRAVSSITQTLVEVVDNVLDVLEAIAIAIAIAIVVIVVVAVIVGTGGAAGAALLAAAGVLAKIGTVLGGAILVGSAISAAGGGRRDWRDVAINAVSLAVGAFGGRVAPALGRTVGGRATQAMANEVLPEVLARSLVTGADLASAGVSLFDEFGGDVIDVLTGPGDIDIGDMIDGSGGGSWGDLLPEDLDSGTQPVPPVPLPTPVPPVPSAPPVPVPPSPPTGGEGGPGGTGGDPGVEIDIDVDIDIDIDVDVNGDQPSLPPDGIIICIPETAGG